MRRLWPEPPCFRPPRFKLGPVRTGRLAPSVDRPLSTEPRLESPALPGPGVVLPVLASVEEIEGVAPPVMVPVILPPIMADAEVSLLRLLSCPELKFATPVEDVPEAAEECKLVEVAVMGVEAADNADFSRVREEERTCIEGDTRRDALREWEGPRPSLFSVLEGCGGRGMGSDGNKPSFCKSLTLMSRRLICLSI